MSGTRKPPINIPNLSLDKLSYGELFALQLEVKREIDSRTAAERDLFIQGTTLTPTQSPRNNSQPRPVLTPSQSLRNSQQRPLLTSSQSMQSSRMFAVPQNTPRKTAAALLECIDKADHEAIEKTWKDHPSVMFMDVHLNESHTTTPLKRALFYLDTHTWKPFYEWCRENDPKMLAEFIKQSAEQTTRIDLKHLQPLTDSYDAYRRAINKWGHHEISDADLDLLWDNVIQLQYKLLPMSFIKEMCRKGVDTWCIKSEFAHKLPPNVSAIYDVSTKTFIEIDSEDFKRFFGTTFGLSRGEGYHISHAVFTPGVLRKGDPAHPIDGHIITHLCDVRTAEIAKIPLLESKSERRVTFNPKTTIIEPKRR